jgi:hypothetical protein
MKLYIEISGIKRMRFTYIIINLLINQFQFCYLKILAKYKFYRWPTIKLHPNV